MKFELLHGDCIETMRGMPDASVDSIVTDPPYGLGFMGRKWDIGVPAVEVFVECLRVLKPGGHLLAFGGTRTSHRLVCAIEDAGFEIRDTIAWLYGSGFPKSRNMGDGWGTALKPALEPICVARKPLIGTVAVNMAAHGTGAINVDGCRVGGEPGRWPANVIHDGSDEVLEAFPDAKGQAGAVGPEHGERPSVNCYGDYGPRPHTPPRIDGSTSAARFFYCAKASRKDRSAGNNHPTVKPTDLMRYLCRMVTPPGGVVLDPFAGSGSTGKAAALEGFRFIGIEADADYIAIARARLDEATEWLS